VKKNKEEKDKKIYPAATTNFFGVGAAQL